MRHALLLAVASLFAPWAHADVIRVGPNEAVQRIGQAARLARDGDTIEIQPGIYRRDVAIWEQDDLRIRGSGPGVILEADGASAEDKAIWVIRGGRIGVENITFRGARVRDRNGAGIRFERGALHVRNCRFVDNENGILAGNTPDARLHIESSVFAQAPHHPGSLHHLLYVGRIGTLQIEGSRFSGGYRAHLIKTRARRNTIAYNLIDDGDDGAAAYELEFPDGGIARVVGNIIGQSGRTTNNALISYGAEGDIWDDNELIVEHNTLISRSGVGPLVQVAPQRRRPPTGRITNNLFIGSRQLAAGAIDTLAGNDFLPRSALSLTHTNLESYWPIPSPRRQTSEMTPAPAREFRFPLGTRDISADTPARVGALQTAPDR